MTGHPQGHPADRLGVHGPVQVVPLQLPPGVGAGPDRGHGVEEPVPEGTEDPPAHIPEAGQDPVATRGTAAGATSDTTEDTAALHQGTGPAAGPGPVEGPITEGHTREADHVLDAENITDLGERYILRFTGAGGAGHEQDLAVGHLST